jgi:hypothetical protein
VFVKELRCLKCGREYAPTKNLYTCKRGGKLDVLYDYDAIAGKIDKETLAKRPAGVWKYREFLPIDDPKNIACFRLVSGCVIKRAELMDCIFRPPWFTSHALLSRFWEEVTESNPSSMVRFDTEIGSSYITREKL